MEAELSQKKETKTMPKFYGQNKKRKDPRYFLNEGKNPDDMISHYKNNPEVWKQFSRNDYLDMSAGRDADGQRQEYYPEWTDDMFQQVVDAMEGKEEPMAPPWEEPGLARKAAMGRAQDLAQQGMAANDPANLSTEEIQAKIDALQAELSNRNEQEMTHPAVPN